MYSKEELMKLKELINKEMGEKYFELGMAETELLFSTNSIKKNGEGHKPFETDITLGEFKEAVELRIMRVNRELEELGSLYLKTNSQLNIELEEEQWELEL